MSVELLLLGIRAWFGRSSKGEQIKPGRSIPRSPIHDLPKIQPKVGKQWVPRMGPVVIKKGTKLPSFKFK